MAFASPLLPLAQIESGGFHLVGTTSIGKTTALNVAASVAGLKTIPNWRSTSNALEGKAGEFVQALETALRQQQGTALDCYLSKLVEDAQVEGFERKLRERVHAIAHQLSHQFKDTAISRVAIRFALVQVGLELAHSYDLLPLAIEQCGWAVRKLFTGWLDNRGGEGSIEIKEACKRIEHLFVSNQHNDDRIADVHNPSHTRNLLAYRSNDSVTDGIEFWVPVSIFNYVVRWQSDRQIRRYIREELQMVA